MRLHAITKSVGYEYATVCIGDNTIVLLTNAAKSSRTCLTEATAKYSISFTSAALPFIARVLKLCTSQKQSIGSCVRATRSPHCHTAESKEEWSSIVSGPCRELRAKPSCMVHSPEPTNANRFGPAERACGHPWRLFHQMDCATFKGPHWF